MAPRVERARRRLADHPITCAVVLVAASSAIALAIAGNGKGKWRDDLRTAVITLIFVALSFLGLHKASAKHGYDEQFTTPLDNASAALRLELSRALGG